MPRLTIHLPSLYADHHVLEVRRILLELPGVSEIYASSAFHAVDVSYDVAVIAPDAIQAALAQAGYSDEFIVPTETKVSSPSEDRMQTSFRHTTAYRHVGPISFAQTTHTLGRPLWPCPGIGAVKAEKSEEDVGYG